MAFKPPQYAYHFGFRNLEDAEDFYGQARAHMLLQLEMWYPYTDWRNYDAVKLLPSIGVNALKKELEHAKMYRGFFAYEVSLHPLDLFGRYRVLRSRTPRIEVEA